MRLLAFYFTLTWIFSCRNETTNPQKKKKLYPIFMYVCSETNVNWEVVLDESWVLLRLLKEDCFSVRYGMPSPLPTSKPLLFLETLINTFYCASSIRTLSRSPYSSRQTNKVYQPTEQLTTDFKILQVYGLHCQYKCTTFIR